MMKMTTMRGKSRKTLTAALEIGHDTIFPAPCDVSPTGAIRRTFCSNLLETGKAWMGWLFEAKKRYGNILLGIRSLRGHSAADCCLLEDFFEGWGEVLKEFGTQGPINAIYRFYQRLSEAALESGMSRIYGGIHFMSANLNGLRSGAAVGNYVFRNFLVRREPRSGD